MGASGGFTKIIQMFLLLILGGQDPDPSAIITEDWSTYGPRGAPAYAEFNMSELVSASKTTPEVKQLLAVASDCDIAAAEVGIAIGADPTVVKEAFSGVRRIGFWVLGLGDDEENIRYQVIIDRGKRADILPKLIANNPKLKPPENKNRRSREGYIATTYNGTTIHGLRSRRGLSMWAAEKEGKLIIASDRFAVQSFLLHPPLSTVKKTSKKPRTKGIIDAKVNSESLLNEVLTMMRSHDREEAAAISSFLDLPAWRTIVMRLSKDRLLARARIESASHVAKVLAPPEKAPALLSAITDKTDLAVVLSVKSPKALWKIIRDGIGSVYTMEGNPDGMARFDAEIKREIGLDIDTDIVDIIESAGYIVPTLEKQRDIERRFALIGQAKDATKAQASLEKFIARIARGKEIQPTTADGTTIWNVDGAKIAQIGSTAMLGVGRRDEEEMAVDKVIKAYKSGQSTFAKQLVTRFPKATCYAVFNPAILFKGRDAGRISAGLMFTQSSVTLDADYSLGKLAKILSQSLKTITLDGKKSQADQKLGKIITGAHNYLAAHGKYPSSFKDIMKYIGNNPDLLISPVSGKRYKFNSKIANIPAGTITNRDTSVFAHEALDGLSEGGGHILFLSGKAQWFTTAEFRKIIKE